MKRCMRAIGIGFALLAFAGVPATAAPPGADGKVTTTVTGACEPGTTAYEARATLTTAWKSADHGNVAFWSSSVDVGFLSGPLPVVNGTFSYSKSFTADEVALYGATWGAEFELYDKRGRLLYDGVTAFTVTAC